MANRWLNNYLAHFSDDFPSLYFNPNGSVGLSHPAVNVKEYNDRFEIQVSVPGVDIVKIKIKLQDKLLTISYEETEDNENKDEDRHILREEFRQYSFSRSISLPKNVDEDSITAKSTNGMLNIIVHKLPETQPREIKIES